MLESTDCKLRFKFWLHYFLSALEYMVCSQMEPQFVNLKNGNINTNTCITEFGGHFLC